MWCYDKPNSKNRIKLVRAIEFVSVKFVGGYGLVGLVMGLSSDSLKFEIIGWIIFSVGIIYIAIIFWWRFNYIQWWRARLNIETIESTINQIEKDQKELDIESSFNPESPDYNDE